MILWNSIISTMYGLSMNPFFLSANTFLILETKDGERRARIQSDYDSVARLVMEKDHISFDIEVPKEFPLRYFVNMYRLTREYGGPEEGGWYWDCMSVENSQLCINEDHANTIFAQWDSNIDHKAQEEEPYYNVNSDGHLICMIEHHRAMQPKRPVYE